MDKITLNFSKTLKRLRAEKNMTQEELAQKLGVSRQTISKWELNQGNPELSKIKEKNIEKREKYSKYLCYIIFIRKYFLFIQEK